MAKKSHISNGIGLHDSTIVWCFKCSNQRVKAGKRCQKCGARCLISPPKKYKSRLVEIRLTEAATESGYFP